MIVKNLSKNYTNVIKNMIHNPSWGCMMLLHYTYNINTKCGKMLPFTDFYVRWYCITVDLFQIPHWIFQQNHCHCVCPAVRHSLWPAGAAQALTNLSASLCVKQHICNCLFTWSRWPWIPLNDASECLSCPCLYPGSSLSYLLPQDYLLYNFYDVLLTTADYTLLLESV